MKYIKAVMLALILWCAIFGIAFLIGVFLDCIFNLDINQTKYVQTKYVSIMQQRTTSAFGLEQHYTLIQAADGSVKRIDGILPIGDTIIIKQ